MTIDQIRVTLRESEEYRFLRETPLIRDNLALLTLGGSHSYGTNVEGSDLDIRGIATNPKQEILLGRDFEQVVNSATDTTIYSVKKIIGLLTKCNPNTIEILGTKLEHLLYVSDAGRILLDNKDAFLSKLAIFSFGGYANDQLRRLINATVLDLAQEEKEKHVLKRIENASEIFKSKYFPMSDDAVHLYLDESHKDMFSMEIFMDINLSHYPVRDWCGFFAEMSNIAKDYDKIGVRNSKAITHKKLGKHMMHLVRLYLMCFDILEKGEIITFREKDHDFLMDIRNGKYLVDNQPTAEFMEILNELEAKMQRLALTTDLPEHPDRDRIDRILADINESVIVTA